MEKINITIDKIEIAVDPGTTILQAAKEVGVDIPTLCYMKELNEIGACRVCLVEVEGARGLNAACMQPVYENMVVKTTTKKVREARKSTLELILSDHDRDCLTCIRNRKCELQDLAEEFGITTVPYEGGRAEGVLDLSATSMVRDQSKCILCGRCVKICQQQATSILDFTERGIQTKVSTAFNMDLDNTPCISCGQCVNVCPVAALREKDDTEKVWDAIDNPDIHVIVQTAPAVRAALGEEFGYPIGTRVTGKMVAALKRLGFDRVYDTNFGADMTIMEEGYELMHRLKNGGTLPMITSCSPGWVTFCEHMYPEFIPNLSSCKSPHQMLGALAKSYYADRKGIDPSKIFTVSVMPCIAKKVEANRPQMEVNGHRDVDVVITTRELARMIKEARIEFTKLEDEEFHQDLMGDYSGAGAIFGATGGVTEAALRTVADVMSGEDIKDFIYSEVRGIKDVKEATVKLGDMEAKIAVVHGTGNAAKLLDRIKAGEAEYHFIEIMACSGGCVNGGGQPHVNAKTRDGLDIRAERGKVLYREDETRAVRKSHQNPQVVSLYKDYLGEPNGHRAHELLHTTYDAKVVYPEE